MALRGWFEDNELTPNEWLELLFEYLRGQDTDDIDRIYRRDEAQELKELFTRYADGQASADELIAFELDFLKDIEGVADWWDQTVSIVEADRIIETMEDNPNGLQYLPSPTGTKTTEYLETAAMSFTGATPTTPITTVGNKQVVLRGGAGVTMSIPEVLESGSIEDLLGVMIPYIPGVSLPDWMPTAGVIFLPTIKDAVDKLEEIIVETDISGALEEGDLGEIVRDIGEIIVGAGTAAADVIEGKVREIIGVDDEGNIVGGVLGGITDPAGSTVAGTILGGIFGRTFPSIPDWLPPLITDPRVYEAVRQVLTENFNTPEDQFPPLTEEVETEQDPNTLFTNRGNNYFVNSETDEYFQLAESEDIDFEFNGQYTREQLEDTGLETINSGTYQSLLDDLSFHALEEDIYQYSMEELIERYEAEGGILPGDWKLMDEESQYNFFLDDYFDIPSLIEDPDKDPDEDPEAEPDADPETDPDADPEADPDDGTGTDTDTSDIADLFSDILEETEVRILQSIAEAGYATPEDIAAAIEEAGLLTAENLADTLEAAGFATPEDITNALQAAGFATPEDIATALEAANILTPEALATALSEAGFATPEDIATALADSGFATPEDIATALQAAGFATPEDITTALNAAGLLTADDLATALSESGFVTAEDLVTALAEAGFTTPEDIASAISGLATPQDIADALDAAGFATPQDIQDAVAGLATPEDIQEALANFNFTDDQIAQLTAAIPEGLTLDQLNETLASALEGVATGEELDAVMEAITGLNFATPEDVENALANFNFTDDQLQQIVDALPPGLNITDLNDALATALDGLALGADLDAATDTIVTAINGLNFATAEDVQNALANFGFTDNQLQQIAGVIPEGLTLAELNEALSSSLAGIALGTDLEDATNTIVNAIDGLAFATPEDIRTALSEFNFTQDQLDQIAALIPDTLRSGEVEDLLSTALTGISRQEDVDTAFAALTTNLSEGIRSLEAGQEEILTGQTRIGEDIQSVEELLMASTGLLGALGAGGAAAPQARPYDPYLEKLSYAPQMVEVERPQPKVDYNKEVDRLLTIGMGGKKPGMLV